MRLRTVGGWLVVAIVLAVCTPAWAHPDVPEGPPIPLPAVDTPSVAAETLAAATPTLYGPWVALILTLLAAVAIARRRAGVAVVCVLLLLVVAFETGVHSVHHLADRPDARCVIASASGHTGGVIVEPVAFEAPFRVVGVVAPSARTTRPARPLSPDLGRAPPAA